MKVIADTNVLVRAVVHDDTKQAQAAQALLTNAEQIALSATCLCEFVWVLHKVYDFRTHDVTAAIEALLNASNVAADRPAINAGLAILKAGGDFADGVVAYEGAWLGGETFVSFDKKAVTLIAQQGQQTLLLK